MLLFRAITLTLLIGLDGLFTVLQAVKIWEGRKK